MTDLAAREVGGLKEASIDLPALRIDIPRIDLYQGNYTTVCFHLMGRSLQVELHITKDGKGRVCMTAEASHHISVVTFDQAKRVIAATAHALQTPKNNVTKK